VGGPYEGTLVSSMDTLNTDPVGDTGRVQLDLFSERLQCMGLTTSGMSIDSDTMDALAKALGDPKDDLGKMNVVATVKNTFKKDERSGEERHYQNIYVRNYVDPSDVKHIVKQLADAENS